MINSSNINWIAVDWGTTNLRVWAMDANGAIIHQNGSNRGMASLAVDEFEEALLELISPYLETKMEESEKLPVICCGMVGSRQGWVEAPYLSVPLSPQADQKASKPVVKDPRIEVFVLPGLKQLPDADVMRGEETQIAGFMQANPEFDGVVCLPGTHTKWAQLRKNEIRSFETCMTGELFALLSEKSVLRHCVEGEGFDERAFIEAVRHTVENPNDLSKNLFRVRASSLVSDVNSAAARGRLSGLLIGAELASTKDYWQGHDVVLIGAQKLSSLYQLALRELGRTSRIESVDEMTLLGLQSAYHSLRD